MESKQATCDVEFVDEERVARVQEQMDSDESIHELAETFKVLGDSTRAKIVFALMHEELCVCDLANLLRLTPSAVSHQLRILRNGRLVKYRKDGKMAYYSLDDDHIRQLFHIGRQHIQEYQRP